MSTSQGGVNTAADVELGGRIANALIVKGLTQRALSDKTGISYSVLRRSLTGGRSLTFFEFIKIAEAIEVDG